MSHSMSQVGARDSRTAGSAIRWALPLMILALCAMDSQAQGQNGTPTVWIELPSFNDDNGNWRPSDMAVLDVLVDGQFIRAYYSTDGRHIPPADMATPPGTLIPGKLRPVDIAAPLRDLATFSMDGEWLDSVPPGEEWIVRVDVANWNKVFDVAQEASVPGYNPPHSKGGALVGMIAHNGFLFVNSPLRRERDFTGNEMTSLAPRFHQYNGLSMLYGPDDPVMSFDPEVWDPLSGDCEAFTDGGDQELFSAGFGGLDPQPGCVGVDPGWRRGVPEGTDIVETSPQNQMLSRFLFVANYCGDHAAGHVLVQDISNLMSIRVAARTLVPLYEYLGDWLEGPSAPSFAPLGVEVPRDRFTCAPMNNPSLPTDIPDCNGNAAYDELVDTVRGNKLRPVLVVEAANWPSMPEGTKGRSFLFCGLNLDPYELEDYDQLQPPVPPAQPTVFPADHPDSEGDNWLHGRDDGKYDYVAIIDVTEMMSQLHPLGEPFGSDNWVYHDMAQWPLRTRFLRLPPDLPPGWSVGDLPPDPDTGYDWSTVTVFEPGDLTTFTDVQIKGSGTPKTMAAGPQGRFVYIITSDQGQESVDENANLHDGGLHVPHLYVLDLMAGNINDQSFLNNHQSTNFLTSYRFNKIVTAEFDTPNGTVVGAVNINSTIPDMPRTGAQGAAVGPTTLNDQAANVGPTYPGEWLLDPTARVRAVAVRNEAFTHHKNRLYVGTAGRALADTADYESTQNRFVGAIHVFGLDGGLSDSGIQVPFGHPTYLRTLTLPQDVPGADTFTVAGMSVLPRDPAWVEEGPGIGPRNVLLVVGKSTKLGDAAENPTDRLVFIQDNLDAP